MKNAKSNGGIITFNITASGKKARKAGNDLFASTGFDTLRLVNIRNWRTRELTPRSECFNTNLCGNPPEKSGIDRVQIHDEEWTFVADGSIFQLSEFDLQSFQEAVGEGFYRAE